jgi:hypothetical protein
MTAINATAKTSAEMEKRVFHAVIFQEIDADTAKPVTADDIED